MAGRKFWQLLAALWFLLTGLLAISNFVVVGAAIAMGFLAIIVALLILLDR